MTPDLYSAFADCASDPTSRLASLNVYCCGETLLCQLSRMLWSIDWSHQLLRGRRVRHENDSIKVLTCGSIDVAHETIRKPNGDLITTHWILPNGPKMPGEPICVATDAGPALGTFEFAGATCVVHLGLDTFVFAPPHLATTSQFHITNQLLAVDIRGTPRALFYHCHKFADRLIDDTGRIIREMQGDFWDLEYVGGAVAAIVADEPAHLYIYPIDW